jgi:Putative prokaryotic signal transducing protein
MSDDLVLVYASVDSFDGELMKGRLESEGISALFKGEGEGPYRVGPAYLWVRAEDEVAARAVVDAVQSGAFALEENADPAVGERTDERSD